MATPAIISWKAPAHIHLEKRTDWYWSVGIITLTLAAVCFIFAQVILGILIIVAAAVLVLHASRPPRTIDCEINDRGIVLDSVLYPFVSLESFWVPHDINPPRLYVKSRKTFMFLIVILIDEVDPEDIREVMLKYIAETEHHEPFLKHLLDWLGF